MNVIQGDSEINNTKDISNNWNNDEENNAVCNSDSENEEPSEPVDNLNESKLNTEVNHLGNNNGQAKTQESDLEVQNKAREFGPEGHLSNDKSQLPHKNDLMKRLQMHDNCQIEASTNFDDAAELDMTSANDEMQNGQTVNKSSDNEDCSSGSLITTETNEKCAGKQSLSKITQSLSDTHIDLAVVGRDEQIEGRKPNDLSPKHPIQNGNYVKPNGYNVKRSKSDRNGTSNSTLNTNEIEKKKLGKSMSVPTFGSKLQRSIRERIQSLSTTNGLPVVRS